MDDGTLVHDSKSAEGAEIAVRSGAWFSFVRAVKQDAEG
ncbi:DUF397 domain-containing protein [Streptomyces sp. B21-108]